MTIDRTRYIGHSPGPLQLVPIGSRPFLCPAHSDGLSVLTITEDDGVPFAAVHEDADARLFVDAHLLLAEVDRLQSENERYKTVLAGLPDGALDGGWTAAGICKYAKSLEDKCAELQRTAELLAIDRAELKHAASDKPAPPRCPTHGFVMCEQFDQQGPYLTPNGKFRCYQCDPVKQGEFGK